MDAITPFDWFRLFLGEDPPLFYLEIVFRILVIWIWTMVLLRWIGGRSISQLSVVEFLLVIALGSAVGDAMFYPEVPLAHACWLSPSLWCWTKASITQSAATALQNASSTASRKRFCATV